MKIKNRTEIVEQLTDMLIGFDKSLNTYQTDIYAYYNAETETVNLDTFVNVGGNSWLNDDHTTIHRDTEHYETAIDFFETEEELVEVVGEDYDGFIRKIAEHNDIDVEQVSRLDIVDYIKLNAEYCDKVTETYNDCIDDARADYEAQAEEIISRYEDEN